MSPRCASLALPGMLLGVFFALPFLLMVLVSVTGGAGVTIAPTSLTSAGFAAALTPGFLRVVLYSFMLAFVAGALSVAVAFPFAWLVARMGRRAQTLWLSFLLTTLSLSEVLIVFAWQILLSRRVGLSNLLVHAGLLAHPENWTPSLGGVLVCLVYLVLPFSVLTLYPPLSHLDPELGEAARTLGASPGRTMLTVTLPMLVRPIASSFALAAIFSLGSYIAPLVLGRPAQWTASVLIGNSALADGNFHAASAMSLVLLAATLLILFSASRLVLRLERQA